jgi:hypothetical protein
MPRKFFVPFLVSVMNHQHKEQPTAAKISRKTPGSSRGAENPTALHAHEADAGDADANHYGVLVSL